MEQQEKEIADKLKIRTEDIVVPESLKSESIEELLHGRKQKKWQRWYRYGLVAACGILMMTGMLVWKGHKNGSTKIEVSNQIAQAKSYDEIYKNISQSITKSEFIEDAAKQKGTANSAQSYSETNVRTEDVAEGDSVKTDGKYLYTLKESAREISVVETVDGRMQERKTIAIETGAQITEFYLQGKKLIVLYNWTQEMQDGEYLGEDTKAVTYDMTDVNNPKELGAVTQSGRYATSRVVGDYLYVFSDFLVASGSKIEDREMYVPSVGGDMLKENKIYMPAGDGGTQYTVVASVNLNQPDKTVDEKAILSKGGMLFVSAEHIYMCDSLYDDESRTVIRKIAYREGVLEPKVQGEVPGVLNDSFSIDEYEGNLRAVTTINKRQLIMRMGEDSATSSTTENGQEIVNALYILDDNLKITGKIEDIARGEEVKSARFIDDMCYFVTFENTDPLFSVDLSEASAPKILGTLKIPGFSQYLHPYGEGELLGIGLDMDEQGMNVNGVKLSMYDITNKADVKERYKSVIDGTYNASVLSDYKAVMFDAKRNLMGFSAYGDTESYYLFAYEEESGFACKLQVEFGMDSYMSAKGIYMDDNLYIVKGNTIQLYSLQDYQKIDDLVL